MIQDQTHASTHTCKVIHVTAEPGNGTHYELVITQLPPGLSAKYIANIYGFGSIWFGDPRFVNAGYLREKIPLLSDSDAKEIKKILFWLLPIMIGNGGE